MTKSEAYATVLQDLQKCSLFTGLYDAKNGDRTYMDGVRNVMELIAYGVSEEVGDAFSDLFSDNMVRCEEKVRCEETVSAEMHEIRTETHGVCSDLISRADSREDAIALLVKAEKIVDQQIRDVFNSGYSCGMERSKESLSAEAEWIPCSDGLPKNDGCMLVTIDDGIEFGKYEDGSWSIWVCEHWDKWDAKGTIAWMPLPMPYREDGEA